MSSVWDVSPRGTSITMSAITSRVRLSVTMTRYWSTLSNARPSASCSFAEIDEAGLTEKSSGNPSARFGETESEHAPAAIVKSSASVRWRSLMTHPRVPTTRS